jgi:hypothetical protein
MIEYLSTLSGVDLALPHANERVDVRFIQQDANGP